MGAGAGAGAIAVVSVVEVVVEDALVLSTVASFFFAHPASTATMQQLAMRVVRCSVDMGPPFRLRTASLGGCRARRT
jgi:hypothetical protein